MDKLAKLAGSLEPINSCKVAFLTLAKAEIKEWDVVIWNENQKPSYKDGLISYLTDDQVPKEVKKAKKLKNKATGFILIDKELYKRVFFFIIYIRGGLTHFPIWSV